MARAAREENLVVHLQSIYTIIPCVFAYDTVILYSQLCSIFAILHNNNEQTCWEPFRTFYKILTKTIFCSNGLMWSFCQNSCWSSRIETVIRDAQTVDGTKWFSLKPTAVRKYYFSAEFSSTALLCGIIHYTNSSSYHADVQLSQIIKGDQWWQPIWEHWCMSPMTMGNGNLVCWPTARLTRYSRYYLWARQVREEAYQWFEQGRFHDEVKTKFHSGLPKVKVKSFSDMNNKVTISVKNNDTSLYADRNLFAWIILTDQSRKEPWLTLRSLCFGWYILWEASYAKPPNLHLHML